MKKFRYWFRDLFFGDYLVRTTTITIIWLILLCYGCAREKISFSTSQQEATQSVKLPPPTPQEAAGDATPGDVVAEEIPAPKAWHGCWLSSRLSSSAALRAVGDSWRTSRFRRADGRQEFTGKSANPANRGACIFNWFGQDNGSEPWVALMWNGLQQDKRYQDSYEAVVTCTSTSTPECTCMTIVPKIFDDDHRFLVGKCVKEDDLGDHMLYDVSDPQSHNSAPANGRCNLAEHNISAVLMEKNSDIMRAEEDFEVTLSSGDSCRIDIEPFAPQADEADWYGSEIRDWAVVTCEDTNTACRSYAIFYKSNREQGERGLTIEQGLMLICEEGSCIRVWE